MNVPGMSEKEQEVEKGYARGCSGSRVTEGLYFERMTCTLS
jgi:hypothetical protein